VLSGILGIEMQFIRRFDEKGDRWDRIEKRN
jgi:hypothetical protein